MIYPKGELIYENLSSEQTDIRQLLSSLKSEGFSGSVEIFSGKTKGTFLVCSGNIIEAVVNTDIEPAIAAGDKTVEELLVICTAQVATISVYKLHPDEVKFSASSVQSEIVLRGLSTDFVRLDRFIKKQQDEKHTGYIEVFTKDNELVYVLFFKSGLIEGSFVYTGSDRPEFKNGNETQAYIKELFNRSLFISVYKTFSPVFKELPKIPIKEATREVKEDVQKEVKTGGEVPVVKEKILLEKKPHPVSVSDSWREIKEAMMSDMEKTVNAVVTANGRSNFLSDIQDIFIKLERFIASVSDKGGFLKVLKRVCVEKSEIYPFLDPFDGQFEYSGGILIIDKHVPFDILCAGLADCLNQTLIYLQKELPKVSVLPPGLKGEIEYSFSSYSEILKNARIQPIVPF
jgi:hypothetical protein